MQLQAYAVTFWGRQFGRNLSEAFLIKSGQPIAHSVRLMVVPRATYRTGTDTSLTVPFEDCYV
jgi:hypothetical protein